MEKQLLNIDSICANCGVRASYECEKCGKPLCGRCRSREKKEILSNIVVHAGLCKECVMKRLNEFVEGTINILSEAVENCHQEEKDLFIP